tara:strand:- start:5351 stop:5491 length:141 start_codon:yes stop_codon:yes gene_type:complete
MDQLVDFLNFRILSLEKKIAELEQTVEEQNNYILSETQNEKYENRI